MARTEKKGVPRVRAGESLGFIPSPCPKAVTGPGALSLQYASVYALPGTIPRVAAILFTQTVLDLIFSGCLARSGRLGL